MGILRRLADRLDPVETRSLDPSWTHLAAFAGGGTATVNPRLAENLGTVMACVSAVSSAMASLPVWVYRRSDRGRDVDPAHAVARLVRDGPNRHQSWADWLEWAVASALLRGNALSEIITDRRGAVIELRPIPWENVAAQVLPRGRLAYDITAGAGRVRRLLEDEVLHLRDRSDDGLIGRSRLQRAAAVIEAGAAVQDFSNAMYRNGMNPSGALMVDGRLVDEQRVLLRQGFQDAFAGTQNAAKALILDQGVRWQQISVSPEDAELLSARRFSTEELARLFQVPPPLVGIWDHSSFTNSETAGRWFAQHTLGPWARKIEAEFARSVFSEAARATHELEIDMSGFLRGDPEQRWKAHEIAVRNNILTPNEVREVEGWNPRADGDQLGDTADG